MRKGEGRSTASVKVVVSCPLVERNCDRKFCDQCAVNLKWLAMRTAAYHNQMLIQNSNGNSTASPQHKTRTRTSLTWGLAVFFSRHRWRWVTVQCRLFALATTGGFWNRSKHWLQLSPQGLCAYCKASPFVLLVAICYKTMPAFHRMVHRHFIFCPSS